MKLVKDDWISANYSSDRESQHCLFCIGSSTPIAYIFCFGHYLAGPSVYVYKWHIPDHKMIHSPYGRDSLDLYRSFNQARQSVEAELIKDGYVFLNGRAFEYDVYWCRNKGHPELSMIMARFGNEKQQKFVARMPESSNEPAVFLKNQPPWYHVALGMARERFLYSL